MERTSDTSVGAHKAQLEVWRRLGPARRVALAIDLSDGIRAVAMDGNRQRHPDYDEDAVRHALYRLTLGDDLYRAAWPGHPLLQP